MQREDPEGIVILCDFCRRDWDGQEAMIEGHHGSILCLQCLQTALKEQKAGDEKYTCNLCLRYNIAPTLPRWSHPDHLDSVACQECLLQAAKAFSRNKEIDWKYDPADYPAAQKI